MASFKPLSVAEFTLAKLEEGTTPGLEWVDKKNQVFSVKWRHGSSLKDEVDPQRDAIFREWAVYADSHRCPKKVKVRPMDTYSRRELKHRFYHALKGAGHVTFTDHDGHRHFRFRRPVALRKPVPKPAPKPKKRKDGPKKGACPNPGQSQEGPKSGARPRKQEPKRDQRPIWWKTGRLVSPPGSSIPEFPEFAP